ncbi:MarR family transcriptional regulator [Saccharibacillus sp. CPCC 101409]|uniref:MarR family winged helix-turn-helix transcriptional regulator n=1 Tax=Saccharibacillus sp. CPCC 101409 TaxID=3058041 RepID=UPI0026712491|nr:MarR family transcriptional regulator [Saccharibacillus sp. CPCC 101409]MDO3409281.1 MarR family transcriptional regulator [Saccharibacillus sp. CPCC 101409]
MGQFHVQLDLALGRMFEVYNALNKKPKEYAPGMPLYLAEIHMIEAIGRYPDSKLTDISHILNVTKGTASKMIAKLTQKNLVSRYQLEDNKKEVYVRLTESGRRAFEGHDKHHESRSADIDREFDSYSAEEQALILHFVQKYTEEMSRYLE